MPESHATSARVLPESDVRRATESRLEDAWRSLCRYTDTTIHLYNINCVQHLYTLNALVCSLLRLALECRNCRTRALAGQWLWLGAPALWIMDLMDLWRLLAAAAASASSFACTAQRSLRCSRTCGSARARCPSRPASSSRASIATRRASRATGTQHDFVRTSTHTDIRITIYSCPIIAHYTSYECPCCSVRFPISIPLPLCFLV